jgi:hypothetical protein
MQKLGTLLFGIAFVILLLITTLALSLRSFVLDPNFYVSTLKAKGVFQRLAQDPLRFVNLSDQIPQLAAVPEPLQARVVTTILPADWLEKQLSNAVQAWVEWFVAGEASTPEIQIDLRQIRDRLQGPPGAQVANDVVNAIPDCAPDQQPQLSFGQLPKCIPAVFDRNAIVDQAVTMLREAAKQMPSQYDVGSRLALGARFGPTLNGQRIGLTMVNTTLWVLVLGTIGVWVIGALIGGRTGRLARLGGLLLAGSIAVLIIGVIVYVFGVVLVPQAWFADLGSELSQIGRSVAQALIQQLGVRSIFGGAVLFIGSLGLIGAGALQKPRSLQYRS